MARIKAVSADTRQKLFFAAVIALIAALAFAFGRLSAFYEQDTGFGIEYPAGDDRL